MDPSLPILDLAAAQPCNDAGEASASEVDLCLRAGEFALVDARHSARPDWLADLCCGLLPLANGSARFLGRDWTAMPQDHAAALRGRIGRVFRSTVAREPGAEEMAWSLTFVRKAQQAGPTASAWARLYQAMFATAEFRYRS